MACEPGDITSYYRDPAIIDRMVQYLGGDCLQEATCVYLSRCDSLPKPPYLLKKPNELTFYLEQGLDVGRSLWDRKSLLFHLDIDYVNYDSPVETFLQREKIFSNQEPLIRAIKKMLELHRILPLHLISGRGHHFVWRVNRDSTTFRRVLEKGYLPASLEGKYSRVLPPLNKHFPSELGKAFSGAGMIMEYLAYQTRESAALECDVPIQITDVMPQGNGRREIVCIDLSEYGDPLHMRMTRIPFSVYRKQTGLPLTPVSAGQVPPIMAMVPLQDSNVMDSVRSMANLCEVAAIAQGADTRIPDRTDETETLVNAYEGSRLRHFHDWFYKEEHDQYQLWPETYDRTPIHLLPPCAQRILTCPNDLLLKPTAIQLIVRIMLSWGWHPRHIAGLIRSKYERDFGWGSLWYEYDAGTRADFYVRIFSGALVIGQDDLEDLTCTSTKQKGLCPGGESCDDLDSCRASFKNRKNHGRLGRGPFNRLLLSASDF